MADKEKTPGDGKGRFGNSVLYGLIAILILGVAALFVWPKDSGPSVNQSVAATLPEADMANASQAEAPVQDIAPATFVEWSLEKYPEPVTFRSGDISVTVTGQPDDPDLFVPELRVNAPGMKEHVLTGEPLERSGFHRIGIGRLNPQARMDHVLFLSYSGGAHCCTSIQAAVPIGDEFVTADLGNWDGGAFDEFPKDLSGDGVADLMLYDNAFLYTFASYADSFAPPRIFNLVGTQFKDVSKAPAFRGEFAGYMNKAHEACTAPEEGSARNGACAGFVAAAARAGEFQDAWAEMLNSYDRDSDWDLPRGCKVKTRPCPEDQEIEYADFPEALYHFLIRTGYIPPGTKLPPPTTAEPGEFE